MNIHGTFHSIDKAAGHKNPGTFFLKPDGTNIMLLCSGAAPELTKGTPLILTGEFTSEHKNNFHVENIEFDTSDPDRVLGFLSGIHFKGLTKNRSRDLLDALRSAASRTGKSWASLPFEQFVNATKEAGVKDEVGKKIADAIGGIERRKELRSLFSDLRITDKDIETLIRLYGSEAYTEAKKEPYAGLVDGLSFGFCDDLAFHEGMEYMDPRRVDAFLTRMGEFIAHSGSCCMRLEEMLNYIRYMQQKSRFQYLPKAYFLITLLKSRQYVVKVSSHYGPVVYPKELYEAEREIIQELKRLQSSAEQTGYTIPENIGNLDSDQMHALGFFETEGVKILTGGPGSGKTTTVWTMIHQYQQFHERDVVQLAAPTGRAAVRMTESCKGEEKAVTLHKLLDVRPYNGKMRCHFNRNMKLPKGLYIIDEMSMTDEIMFLNLLRALPDHTTLILVGDPDQLPSVQAGTVLKDLLLSNKFEHVMLTGNHRQGDGTSIITNYRKIKDRETLLTEDKDFRVIRAESDENALRALGSIYQMFERSHVTGYQILTAVNVGGLGKYKINSLVSDARLKEAGDNALPGGYCIGDKVIMTRNNYASNYWNGDIGIVSGVTQDGELLAQFYDGTRTISREDMVDMEHAFAVTIHKAQGSEFPYAVIVLGQEYGFMLSNALILTAVTRAQKGVIIISVGDALEQAISADGGAGRITGLRDMLEAT
ncbi:MAG: AAA family ATPase [Clostridiales bacterium]|nr:AAA family ATPase [Clostridiales bacterium]